MAQLRRDYDKFKEQNAEIIVIGPEGADEFKTYWSQNELPFTGLPDPEQRVLKLYGQQVSIFKFGRMPAQIIVDQRGFIRYAHYSNSMQDIPKNEEILKLLKKMEQ